MGVTGKIILLLGLAAAWLPQPARSEVRPERYDAYDVVWRSRSGDASGSMPVGNGDTGCNVWVTETGRIECCIGKTDAFSELNSLLKVGGLSVAMTPNLLAGGEFEQRLNIRDGVVEISGSNSDGAVSLRFWVDAHAPVIRLEGEASVPVKVEVRNTTWRKAPREISGLERHAIYGLYDAPFATRLQADTLLHSDVGMAWAHRNESSIYLLTLQNQNLADWYDPADDPLLHRTFGALVCGPGMRCEAPDRLVSVAADRKIAVATVVGSGRPESLSEWLSRVEEQARKLPKGGKSLARHRKWWNDFWLRHYIFVGSEEQPEEAFTLTRAYILQRYMNAAAGRGRMPIKFNGSIFNVELTHDMAGCPRGLDADFRLWGGPYWWQNTRLPYSSMLFSGDWEMMRPLFRMYREALPLAEYRTRRYFGHEGAYFPETMCFWGTYAIDNYGWDRTGLADGVSQNRYIRYYFQSNIELVALMLAYYEFSEDDGFLTETLFPVASRILTFYDRHYPKSERGEIVLTPAQSLETYFEGVRNPLPDIAGLRWITTRLKSCCGERLPDDLAALCDRMAASLPPIPTGESPEGEVLVAGEQLGERMNVEKPELYAVFPYRWYGVGEPGLDVARRTYARRAVKESWGWQQDGIFAANLGLTDEARRIVTANSAASNPAFRFPVMWGPNYDWVPDQDHGSVLLRTLQNMLIQYGGDDIHLLPAWPADWSVEFKVYGPRGACITGSYGPKAGTRIERSEGIGRQNLIVHNPRKPHGNDE